MKVKKIQLTSYGRFSQIEVPLAPTPERTSNITVIIGNNGAGKTSLLSALATALSWFVGRLRTEKGNGSPILETEIKNDSSTAQIDIEVFDAQGQEHNHDAYEEDFIFHWSLSKTRKGRISESSSDYFDVTRLANHYRAQLTTNSTTSLPLIAFYPVERVVLDIPLKIRGKHSFQQLDGYDNSLNQGVDFRRFFEWFRKREDAENETSISQELLVNLSSKPDINPQLWKILSDLHTSTRDKQLAAVRSAITTFMPDFSNLRVQRKPKLRMVIDKQGTTLDVAQLSQGEKSLMALVGSIASRLAMMNPSLENPLLGDGIVLIDEIDLHLHPKWQRSLLSRFSETFTNCQFIATTHSPIIISDTKDILCLCLNDGNLIELPNLYGFDANQVLLEAMDTDIRNPYISTQLLSLLDHIQNGDLDNAKLMLKTISQDIPENNIELIKAKLLIKRLEIQRAKNN